MSSYNVAAAKAHLSELLERVSEGEEVILTRRGKPIARIVPMKRSANILGAGKGDPNINMDVIKRDEWWKPMPDEEAKDWYE